MIICQKCKKAFSIVEDCIEQVLDDQGHTIGWNHKGCKGNEEKNTSGEHKTGSK